VTVFHPGHEALHGVTVVVEGSSGRLWVGRYHETTERGVVLHDVAIHDSATVSESRERWIERLRKFGIKVEEPFVLLPAKEAGRITRLTEWRSLAASK